MLCCFQPHTFVTFSSFAFNFDLLVPEASRLLNIQYCPSFVGELFNACVYSLTFFAMHSAVLQDELVEGSSTRRNCVPRTPKERSSSKEAPRREHQIEPEPALYKNLESDLRIQRYRQQLVDFLANCDKSLNPVDLSECIHCCYGQGRQTTHTISIV